MTDPHQTLEDIAQAFGLLGQPPYVSVLAQQHALAKTGEQVLTLPALVQQQQALLTRLLARLAPEDAHGEALSPAPRPDVP